MALRTWYVRRGTVEKGPYPEALIKRFLLLGRIRPDDELSPDGEHWAQPAAFSMFASADEPIPVPADEDERGPIDRRAAEAEGPPDERRRGVERRAPESPETVERRQRRARVAASLQTEPPSYRGTLWKTALVVMVIIGSGIHLTMRSDTAAHGPDCSASAAPGINWNNCRLDGMNLREVDLTGAQLRNSRAVQSDLFRANLADADLAYADLSLSLLGHARLERANLKGADLRKADLAYAALAAADLSYANLRDAVLGGADLAGARLDNAIWVDGRTCAENSIGVCR